MHKGIKFLMVILFASLMLAGVTACGKSRTSTITQNVKLNTPTNLQVELDYSPDDVYTTYTLKWNRVNGAKQYLVTADNKELYTKNTYLDVTNSIRNNADTCRFSITAEGYENNEISNTSVLDYEIEHVTFDLQYTKLTDGYSVSRGEADVSGSVIIPDKINGTPIIDIPNNGFEYTTESDENFYFDECSHISYLRLSKYTKKIGDFAFFGSHFDELKLPDSLEKISNSSFFCCQNIKQLFIPASVEEIGSYAFGGRYDSIDQYPSISVLDTGDFSEPTSSLKYVTIEEGSKLKVLDSEAFRSCLLESFTLPENLETLGKDCFSGCKYMQEINVHENNTHFKSVDGIVYSYDMKTLIACPPGYKAENFILPDNVSTISSYAFFCVCGIKHYDVSSAEYIEISAFNTTHADTITLSAKTNVSDRAFSCAKLRTIILPNDLTEITVFEFFDTYMDYIIIPHSVKKMGYRPFDFIKFGTPTKEDNQIKYIFYCGNEDEWEQIGYNTNMGEAAPTICFYSENKPTGSGNFWHYDSDGTTPLLWY